MSDPYLGQIVLFAGGFAPKGWATCDGQLLNIGENQNLFALIGTTYGGDGKKTFGLPDLRGRLPMHQGKGHSTRLFRPRVLGEMPGTERVRLSVADLPTHGHVQRGTDQSADTRAPTGAAYAGQEDVMRYAEEGAVESMNQSAVGKSGDDRGHTNCMPSLCVTFIIALEGRTASRT